MNHSYQESQADLRMTVDTPDVKSSQDISASQKRTPYDVKNNEKPNTQAPTLPDAELQKLRPVRRSKRPVWMKDFVAK